MSTTRTRISSDLIATTTRISAALLVTAAFTASANAEYRCDPAPNWTDRAACEAANQGPDALRRFVQTMNTLRINLQFTDYVDFKTAERWDAQRRQTAEEKSSDDNAVKLALSERG